MEDEELEELEDLDELEDEEQNEACYDEEVLEEESLVDGKEEKKGRSKKGLVKGILSIVFGWVSSFIAGFGSSGMLVALASGADMSEIDFNLLSVYLVLATVVSVVGLVLGITALVGYKKHKANEFLGTKICGIIGVVESGLMTASNLILLMMIGILSIIASQL